jgi:hypothetical protein
MSNDPTFNPQDKNQAIQDILYKKREIARLQEHFGITNADLEQAANPVSQSSRSEPTENTTYEHGKKVGAWLKNVLK